MRVEKTVLLERSDVRDLSTWLCENPQNFYAVDTEWWGHEEAEGQPVGIGNCFSVQVGFYVFPDGGEPYIQAYYIHNYGSSSGNIAELAPWLTQDVRNKVLHNAAVDWHILYNEGIVGKGFFWDTSMMDFLYDERREGNHGLKECARDHLKQPRKSFKETFSVPVLKKDGTPSKNTRLMTLPEASQTPEGFDVLVDYALQDVIDGIRLFYFYQRELKKLKWGSADTVWGQYEKVEGPVLLISHQMEREGIALDCHLLEYRNRVAAQDVSELYKKIVAQVKAPLNLGSTNQLAHLLYGQGILEVKKTKTAKKVLFAIPGFGLPCFKNTPGGGLSTDGEALEKLQSYLKKSGKSPDVVKVVDDIFTLKKVEKMRTTYLTLPEKTVKERLHGRINFIGTTSGRWSMSQPNLQNVPGLADDPYKIREAFVCDPLRVLVIADFANLEYRLLAHMSKDPTLLKLFREGWDMHSFMAYSTYPEVKAIVDKKFGGPGPESLKFVQSEFKSLRTISKILNFEIIYGVGAAKLADQLGITKEDAQKAMDGWYKTYSKVGPFFDGVIQTHKYQGYCRTLGGRIRRANLERLNHHCRPGCRFIKEGRKRCGIQGEEERTLKNAIIQGGAADVMKKAMLNLWTSADFRRLGMRIHIQVHDELVMSVPLEHVKEAVDLTTRLMSNPYKTKLLVDLPVSVGVGPTWASKA